MVDVSELDGEVLGSQEQFSVVCEACETTIEDVQDRCLVNGRWFCKKNCAGGLRWFERYVDSSKGNKEAIAAARTRDPKGYEFKMFDLLTVLGRKGPGNRGKWHRMQADAMVQEIIQFHIVFYCFIT